MLKQQNINNLIDIFKAFSNSENAFFMSKYMKENFIYFGIKTPLRREITIDWISSIKKNHSEQIPIIAKELWLLEEREFQYVALELLFFHIKKVSVDFIDDIEWFITKKSWWDTVDMLSVHVAGKYFQKYPNETIEKVMIWNKSKNMWLNRAAILFQLKYKQDIDLDLLEKIILTHAESKEFFIQKAIGWMLREHSKRDSKFVWDFLDSHKLKPLCIREASKYL